MSNVLAFPIGRRGAAAVHGFHVGDVVVRKDQRGVTAADRRRKSGLGQIRMIRWSPDYDDFLFDVAWSPYVREAHRGPELLKVPRRGGLVS